MQSSSGLGGFCFGTKKFLNGTNLCSLLLFRSHFQLFKSYRIRRKMHSTTTLFVFVAGAASKFLMEPEPANTVSLKYFFKVKLSSIYCMYVFLFTARRPTTIYIQ
jgi:hypothetical protein